MSVSRTRMLFALAALGFAALTGCSADKDGDSIVFGTATVTALPTPSQATPASISPEAANQLCDMIGTEIGNWRDQGSAIAKVSFNGTVQNWATRNDAINADVLRDKSLIDTVTTATCPQVRTQAIEVLHTDDLAGALLGFGG